MLRIDTHHHIIPSDYRKALHRAGIDEAGGRALPGWSAEAALQTMAEVDVALRRAFEDVFGPAEARLPEATTG